MVTKRSFKRIILNLARFLSILYLCFLTIFAFDESVFTIGFLMHLLPSIIVLICLLIGWKSKKTSTILFLLLGIVTIVFFNTYRNLIIFCTISMPLFIISSLFLTSYLIKIKKNK